MSLPGLVDGDAEDEPQRERWESLTEWPLMSAALLFLVVYAWPILDTTLDPALASTLSWIGGAIWVMFVADYLVRLLLSRRRWQFVRSNLFGLAVIALPALRPLRLLQALTLLTVLNRFAGRAFRGRVILYIICSAALLMFIAALAMLQAERGAPGANITTFWDAVWWAMTTVTTVGYGDTYPVTDAGRTVAAGLMFAGVAMVGAVTATFASWLIERVAEVDDESDPASAPASQQDVAQLTAEIAALRAELERRDR